jgi:hypothetical protein
VICIKYVMLNFVIIITIRRDVDRLYSSKRGGLRRISPSCRGLTQQLLAFSRSGNHEIDAYRPADRSAAAAPAAFLPRESD